MRVQSKSRESVSVLLQSLNSERESSRLCAMLELMWAGPNAKRAVPSIVRLLRNGSTQERKTASYALGRIGMDVSSDKIVKALAKSLSIERSTEMISMILGALSRMGPLAHRACPNIVRKLKQRKHSTHAASALSEMGPLAYEGIPTLTKQLKSRASYVRARAAYTLGKIGPLAMSTLPILKALKMDKHPRVRKCATRAVQKIRILHHRKRHYKIDNWMYYFRRDKHD